MRLVKSDPTARKGRLISLRKQAYSNILENLPAKYENSNIFLMSAQKTQIVGTR